ncbi:MAG: DUF1297 domain-containing protein [Candidatus Altiarchaeales archaeon]|nr:DUF1297 domain-containing protein [Candidatus Altiarchaeales archaeon]
MIGRRQIQTFVSEYDLEKIKVGVLASHSALDVADGAKDEQLSTKLYCQRGREKTYTQYFKSRLREGNTVRGCVDEFEVFERFNHMQKPAVSERMRKENVVFIPNRSFTSYLDIDVVEEYPVPYVGSRNLLRSEERGEQKDYYWMLEQAGLPYPEKIKDHKNIDDLCIVKLHHAEKKLERGFFTAATPREYQEKAQELIKQGVITQNSLEEARIERYIIGPVFNLDFFYNPLEEEYPRLELLGVDWRFESSLDGHVRLTAPQQLSLKDTKQEIPEMTVCGHNSATIRESLLDKAFELGEKYVKASQKYSDPGIIGAFCLQTCIDKDLNYYIYDVAPRIGGGTNVHLAVGHPYGNALWRRQMSTGRRTAKLIKDAISQQRVEEIVT